MRWVWVPLFFASSCTIDTYFLAGLESTVKFCLTCSSEPKGALGTLSLGGALVPASVPLAVTIEPFVGLLFDLGS